MIEIKPKKTAIEVVDEAQRVEIIKALQEAIKAGELDGSQFFSSNWAIQSWGLRDKLCQGAALFAFAVFASLATSKLRLFRESNFMPLYLFFSLRYRVKGSLFVVVLLV